MAREDRFLKRITNLGQMDRNAPTASEDLDALMESVREHLALLLNARHGLSEALPDYGLPALVDLHASSVNRSEALENVIRATIERYEPRLRRVRVKHVVDEETEDRESMLFRIDGVLVGRDAEHRVWYETSVSGTGQFDVQG